MAVEEVAVEVEIVVEIVVGVAHVVVVVVVEVAVTTMVMVAIVVAVEDMKTHPITLLPTQPILKTRVVAVWAVAAVVVVVVTITMQIRNHLIEVTQVVVVVGTVEVDQVDMVVGMVKHLVVVVVVVTALVKVDMEDPQVVDIRVQVITDHLKAEDIHRTRVVIIRVLVAMGKVEVVVVAVHQEVVEVVADNDSNRIKSELAILNVDNIFHLGFPTT